MGGCASNLDCPCCCLHCASGQQGSSVHWCCFGCSEDPNESRCDWPCFKCWSGGNGTGLKVCLCFGCSCGHGKAIYGKQHSGHAVSATAHHQTGAAYPETGAAAPTVPQTMQAPQQQGGMYPAVSKY